MKVIGETSSGSALVEMSAAEVDLVIASANLFARLGSAPPVQAAAKVDTAAPPVARRKPARTTLGARRCRNCGKEFFPVRKDQTCCSKVCRKQHDNQNRKQRDTAESKPVAPAEIPPKINRMDLIRQTHQRVYNQDTE